MGLHLFSKMKFQNKCSDISNLEFLIDQTACTRLIHHRFVLLFELRVRPPFPLLSTPYTLSRQSISPRPPPPPPSHPMSPPLYGRRKSLPLKLDSRAEDARTE